MDSTQQLLLSLLRSSLFREKPDASMFAEADWASLFRLADVQTVSSLLLDGTEMLPPELLTFSLDLKLKQIGQMQRMEQLNRLHRSVIIKIDNVLKAEGIQAVFMKGQTTALRYPNPLHRTPGDIDFVVSSDVFDKTMAVMQTIGSVDHDLVHEHHGMAWVDGVTVEPHYKVHNYQRPSADRTMQKMFADIFPAHLYRAAIDGHEVSIFPPTFESVFLISHMVNHIYEEGLGLRQVIDYTLFLNACADKIEWAQHQIFLRRMHMERAWRIFTCISVAYLGLPLPTMIEPFSRRERQRADKMMEDIMQVGNFGRGKYVFQHNGMADAWRNYCWVAKRCVRLGFVCPSEARWWLLSKVKRFFWKEKIKRSKRRIRHE